MRAGIAGWRAVAPWCLAGNPLEALCPPQQHLQFGFSALVGDKLVLIAVMPDLMPVGVHLFNQLGVGIRRPARHKEGRLEAVFFKQLENARHPDPRSVLAARELAWEGLPHGAGPQRFRIKVKTQTNRTAFIIRPHGTLLCHNSGQCSV